MSDGRGTLTKEKARSTPRAQRTFFSAFFACCAFSAVFFVACGKKGPPLAPLVKLPSPPTDLTAERRGDAVDLQLTIPATNSDGSHPANISSMDVYGVTLPPVAPVPPLTDQQLLKLATKVASTPVKAPKDPNDTVEEDDPDEAAEPLEGKGLDQGAVTRAHETLTPAMLTAVEMPKASKRAKAADLSSSGPLVGAPAGPALRSYFTAGVTTRGKNGPLSKRVTVPLLPPPPAPGTPALSYGETAITVTWPPVAAGPTAQAADADEVLPSTPIGVARPVIAYNVYDASGPEPVRLTEKPIAEPKFVDPRVTWGEKRCYVARTAETVSGTSIESEASPQVCETLVDTFPPAAPKALQAVPSDGTINLIWEPNTESDLAGYLVLRATAPGDDLQPLTPQPIPDPSFKDTVPAGVRYVYAVKAVDKAGNVGPLSNRVEETAR